MPGMRIRCRRPDTERILHALAGADGRQERDAAAQAHGRRRQERSIHQKGQAMIPRRQLLAGAVVAPLLNSAATARAQDVDASAGAGSRGPHDWISLRDFGAVGDGVTDDTAAVQAALDAASGGKLLIVPQGKFRVLKPLRARGLVNLFGFGAETSELMLDAAGALEYDGGGAADTDRNQLTIRSVGLRCLATRKRDGVGAVLDVSFSGGRGGTAKTAIIEDIEVTGVDESVGFDCALRFNNARNLKIDGARIRGNRHDRGRSIGIDIGGDASPVDIFLAKISGYFLQRAVNIGGTVEGVYLSQSVFVAVDHGVYARLPHVNPLLFVHNCHINAFRSCIDISNFVQFDLSHNLLYAAKPIAPLPGEQAKLGFVAISVAMHENIGLTSRISCNTVIGTLPIEIPKNGIYVDGEKSEFSLTIDGNEFVGWDTAVILGTGTSGIGVAASNRFRSNQRAVLDLSGANVAAGFSVESPGYRRDDDGIETKWGSSTVRLDETGKGKVPLSPPFKARILMGMGTDGDPASSAASCFVVDQPASTAAELVFVVRPNPGAVAVRMHWMAIGV